MTANLASIAVVTGLSALALGAPVDAHHAIGATVDTSKQLVSIMTLTKVDFINPHAWFHFTMKQPNGALLKDVMIEWLSLAGMKQLGINRATDFDVGTTFEVTYNPNRDGSPGGHMVKIIDEEGKVFQR